MPWHRAGLHTSLPACLIVSLNLYNNHEGAPSLLLYRPASQPCLLSPLPSCSSSPSAFTSPKNLPATPPLPFHPVVDLQARQALWAKAITGSQEDTRAQKTELSGIGFPWRPRRARVNQHARKRWWCGGGAAGQLAVGIEWAEQGLAMRGFSSRGRCGELRETRGARHGTHTRAQGSKEYSKRWKEGRVYTGARRGGHAAR